MQIYIVVLNWNGWRDTVIAVESVLGLRAAKFQIVICDNCSTDESVEMIRFWCNGESSIDIPKESVAKFVDIQASKFLHLCEYDRAAAELGGIPNQNADVFLLHTGGNLGFAGGCNVGLRFAIARGDADFVWLLNNDTVVDPDALAALVRRAGRTDRPGLIGSTLCFMSNPGVVQSFGGGTFNPRRAMSRHIAEGQARRPLSDAEVREIEAQMVYVVGASMLVSRDFLAQVGLMQEDYFLYFEEMDWAEQARRVMPGFRLGFAADSIVYHKVGASAGTNTRSLSSLRYFTVNRLRFIKRFYRSYLPAARLAVFWDGMKAMLKGRIDEALLVMRVAVSPISV